MPSLPWVWVATRTVFDLLGEDYDAREPAEALAVVDRALLFIGGGISALRGAATDHGLPGA